MSRTVRLDQAAFKRGVDDVLTLRPFVRAVAAARRRLRAFRIGASAVDDPNGEIRAKMIAAIGALESQARYFEERAESARDCVDKLRVVLRLVQASVEALDREYGPARSDTLKEYGTET